LHIISKFSQKLNSADKNNPLLSKIFSVTEDNLRAVALELFRYQYEHSTVYNQYCKTLHTDIDKVNTIEKIPFLPISLFKTHTITTTGFTPAAIFESSGTTGTVNSKHFVKDLDIYTQSFTKGFELFYGNPKDWCILALLPSYLERTNSSLVVMADALIKQSGHVLSGFYLDDLGQLANTLKQLEQQQQKTLLLGVTFALLDFAAQYPMSLEHTIIMETGGMKGRRKEITRQEVHDILCNSFHLPAIHSEYGMTELLSQAYAKTNGAFVCPPWMKILIRDEDDPLMIHSATRENPITGVINIIDLANIYSCSFIATDDAGKLYPNKSFEVLGRLDNSDIRGCSLLSI
jgi:phenylacetate-coenzyme A ligase PaaK-like adenylate-forming protein